MKIGVLGDTHNNLKNVRRIVELFNAAGVEQVVHTGDITMAKTLDALSGLEAPLHGVYGNNDVERDPLERSARGHEMQIVEPPLELEWAGRRIVVVHDPRELDGALASEHHLALHGHTHLYRLEHTGPSLIFSPGECAGMLPGLNAVGVVDLLELRCDLLRF